jgi:poly(A) polymerase
MREVWMMQPRFDRRFGSTPYSLVEQARYRAGYDFLRLRADAGEVDPVLAEWWEDFALGTDDEREAMIAAAREAQGGARRCGAPRAGRAAAGTSPTEPSAAAAAGHDDGEPDDDAEREEDVAEPAPPAARKRRRRRRKPAGPAGPGPGGPAAPTNE